MKEVQFVYKPPESKLEAEYGSEGNVRFADPSWFRMRDSQGLVSDVPQCDSCGSFKAYLMGKEAFATVCPNPDCVQDNKNE